MKHLVVMAVALLTATSVWSQKSHLIRIPNENIDKTIANRTFYIDTVIDKRINQEYLGKIQVGALGARCQAVFESGLATTLQGYFDYGLPKKQNQIPITIIVNTFELSESSTFNDETTTISLDFSYYFNNKQLLQCQTIADTTDIDVTNLYDDVIRKALKQSISNFNSSNWVEKITQTIIAVNENTNITIATKDSSTLQLASPAPALAPETSTVHKNRNVFAIGYQLGGYSLIGFESEIRMNDYFGLNFGIGFEGFTVGGKIHTSPKKNSGFINISYKDGGFGRVSTFGAEYGKRLQFSKKSDLAFHFQIGLASLISIDEDLAKELFDSTDTPSVMPTMGIGLSW
jgi:hypothetical protein